MSIIARLGTLLGCGFAYACGQENSSASHTTPPAGISATHTFWMWFQANETRLFDFEKDQKNAFDDLTAAMHQVNPQLAFEFGPKSKEGTREFTISADGRREAFPAVEELYASKPSLPRWDIKKFRQRHAPMEVQMNGQSLKPADVRVHLCHSQTPEKIALLVFLPKYSSANHSLGNLGFLMLDQALGEYDMETKVGEIQLIGQDSPDFHSAIPLEDLPAAFDRSFKNLSH